MTLLRSLLALFTNRNSAGRVADLPLQRLIEVDDVQLAVNPADPGGAAYAARSSFEERNSAFHSAVRGSLNPDLIIDVGANYGFTTIVFAKQFPDAQLVAVEASPALIACLRENLIRNGVKRSEVIEAVCGEMESPEVSFAINPKGSQDSRVIGNAGWQVVPCAATTLDVILAGRPAQRLLVKIDTQGFEPQVFSGARNALGVEREWLVKAEFAPMWLESQGNSPEAFLEDLIVRYQVTEAPQRFRYGDDLSHLFKRTLSASDVPVFVRHVRALDARGRGWVDLLVTSRCATWLNPSA